MVNHSQPLRRQFPAELVFRGTKVYRASGILSLRRIHISSAAAHCDRNGVAGDPSILLSGQSFRTRLRVPRELLDGSSRSMETRHRLSAMGRPCAVRIRRGPIHLLSTSFMDARSGIRRAVAVESGSRRLCLVGADAIWMLHVPSGSAMAGSSRCHLRRRVVCRKPLLHRDCVLAERVRGTAGRRVAASALTLRAALGRRSEQEPSSL